MTALAYKSSDKQGLSLDMLTGLQKASVFLLALPTNYVESIFDKLEETEITLLVQSMSSLGKVSAEIVQKVFDEFVEHVSSTGNLVGSFYAAQRLLTEVLGEEKARSIMADVRGPSGRTIWDKLCNINVEVLVKFLRNEHPQAIALILSQLPAAHTATILSLLPQPLAAEVILRSLKIESVQAHVMKDMESTLKREFMTTMTLSNTRDPHQALAEVFNSFERATESAFMEVLETHNAEAAARIKSLMFTFDDLARLDGFSLQKVIRSVDNNRLLVALRGADERMKDLFFTNMSERAAKLMREDIQSMPPVRLKEVEEAQIEIVRQAKSLMDAGEVSLRESDQKELYV